LGGTLTNFRTIRQRVDYMVELERRDARGELDRLPKKEALLLRRELERLHNRIGGLRSMTHVPDILFIVDIQRESLAVEEAHKLHIPIVAMVDTNCDPDPIDHPIASNDDAIRAIKLMTGKMADAVLEGAELRAIDEADRAASQPQAYEPEIVAEMAAEKPRVAIEEDASEPDAYLGPSILARLAEGLDDTEGDEG
jgi:small subunit ribosomal protein S2